MAHTMTRRMTRNLTGLITGLALSATAAGAQQKIELRRAASPEMSARISGAFGSLKVVGWAKDSCSEMVGNSIGSPPASMTPRFTASISSGTLR